MPVVISSVAICQIFTKLFSVTPTGVINALLSVFNPDLLYMEWISNDSLSLIIAASVEGYKYLGLYMVIFYAALIGIPKELDEAAIMDGANVIQQYRYVKNTVYQTGNHSKLHPGIKMALCVLSIFHIC